MKRMMALSLPMLFLIVGCLSVLTPKPINAATPKAATPATASVAILRCSFSGGVYQVTGTSTSSSDTTAITASSCAQSLADQINAGLKISSVQMDSAGSLTYTLVGGAGGGGGKDNNTGDNTGDNTGSNTDDNTQH